VEVLLDLPALDAYPANVTHKSLSEAIARLEADAESREADYEQLQVHVKLFSPHQRPAVSELAEYRASLADYLSRKNGLDKPSQISTLLGARFNGASTSTSPLRDLAELCQAVLTTHDPDRVANAIAEARAKEGIQCAKNLRDAIKATTALEQVFASKTRFTRESDMITGSYAQRANLLREAATDLEGLGIHSGFAGAREECPQGLHVIIDAFATSTNGYSGLTDMLEALAYRTLARQAYEKHGTVLARFSGARLDELRTRLAQLDKDIIRETRKDLRARLKAEARPPRGIGTGRKSTWTDLSLITNELDKKKKHISMRELTRRASAALLELKPCWMMSPLAVAQYLPKQGVKFDLCIIDEASQMPPEDAIGALVRSKQAMIVGDTNQLPPSHFFRKMIDNDDEEIEEDENVLSESVLELANATFRPGRRLRWHYRSRHPGLIKFSNKLVYNDNLVVFPSASEGVKGMGVDFRAVPGLYKASVNPIEAQEMVRAAIDFMVSDPHRSLGIVTLNQKQRDLIFEEMEIALQSNPAAMRYVEYWTEHNDGLEEFFIKNLENVQGDERDVIFVGTVYGPEEAGARVMQRFGPINGVAGKRRLNVLFTRAKQQIVTFSSMNAGDITAEPTGNEGAYMLKRWLEYAATGVLEAGGSTGKEPDSDFEIFVMNQIRAMGCIPVPQVGVKGYSIDIGVKHPSWPHGFILGVECDGAAFHSSRSARDRDRLRQEVLEGLGWRFHRIWSTDWFANPAKQAEILRGVIEARMSALKAREAEFSRTSREPAAPAVEPEATAESKAEEIQKSEEAQTPLMPPQAGVVSIGDTVRVRYLGQDRSVVQFTISADSSDPENGIVYFKKPIAEALLGAEEGEEIEILVGSYVRQAVLEKILSRQSSPTTNTAALS
jgi:transcription elongation GreA/GreB family factor